MVFIYNVSTITFKYASIISNIVPSIWMFPEITTSEIFRNWAVTLFQIIYVPQTQDGLLLASQVVGDPRTPSYCVLSCIFHGINWVSLGGLRSRCQDGIRRARDLLGQMFVKNKGRSRSKLGNLHMGISSDTQKEREKQG